MVHETGPKLAKLAAKWPEVRRKHLFLVTRGIDRVVLHRQLDLLARLCPFVVTRPQWCGGLQRRIICMSLRKHDMQIIHRPI